LNATWPAVTTAAGLPEVTVAVNVTGCPEPEGFWDELMLVVVAAVGDVTANVAEPRCGPAVHPVAPPPDMLVLLLSQTSAVQVPTSTGVNAAENACAPVALAEKSGERALTATILPLGFFQRIET
jgi:hypothetical protein